MRKFALPCQLLAAILVCIVGLTTAQYYGSQAPPARTNPAYSVQATQQANLQRYYEQQRQYAAAQAAYQKRLAAYQASQRAAAARQPAQPTASQAARSPYAQQYTKTNQAAQPAANSAAYQQYAARYRQQQAAAQQQAQKTAQQQQPQKAQQQQYTQQQYQQYYKQQQQQQRQYAARPQQQQQQQYSQQRYAQPTQKQPATNTNYYQQQQRQPAYTGYRQPQSAYKPVVPVATPPPTTTPIPGEIEIEYEVPTTTTTAAPRANYYQWGQYRPRPASVKTPPTKKAPTSLLRGLSGIASIFEKTATPKPKPAAGSSNNNGARPTSGTSSGPKKPVQPTKAQAAPRVNPSPQKSAVVGQKAGSNVGIGTRTTSKAVDKLISKLRQARVNTPSPKKSGPSPGQSGNQNGHSSVFSNVPQTNVQNSPSYSNPSSNVQTNNRPSVPPKQPNQSTGLSNIPPGFQNYPRAPQQTYGQQPPPGFVPQGSWAFQEPGPTRMPTQSVTTRPTPAHSHNHPSIFVPPQMEHKGPGTTPTILTPNTTLTFNYQGGFVPGNPMQGPAISPLASSKYIPQVPNNGEPLATVGPNPTDKYRTGLISTINALANDIRALDAAQEGLTGGLGNQAARPGGATGYGGPQGPQGPPVLTGSISVPVMNRQSGYGNTGYNDGVGNNLAGTNPGFVVPSVGQGVLTLPVNLQPRKFQPVNPQPGKFQPVNYTSSYSNSGLASSLSSLGDAGLVNGLALAGLGSGDVSGTFVSSVPSLNVARGGGGGSGFRQDNFTTYTGAVANAYTGALPGGVGGNNGAILSYLNNRPSSSSTDPLEIKNRIYKVTDVYGVTRFYDHLNSKYITMPTTTTTPAPTQPAPRDVFRTLYMDEHLSHVSNFTIPDYAAGQPGVKKPTPKPATAKPAPADITSLLGKLAVKLAPVAAAAQGQRQSPGVNQPQGPSASGPRQPPSKWDGLLDVGPGQQPLGAGTWGQAPPPQWSGQQQPPQQQWAQQPPPNQQPPTNGQWQQSTSWSQQPPPQSNQGSPQVDLSWQQPPPQQGPPPSNQGSPQVDLSWQQPPPQQGPPQSNQGSPQVDLSWQQPPPQQGPPQSNQGSPQVDLSWQQPPPQQGPPQQNQGPPQQSNQAPQVDLSWQGPPPPNQQSPQGPAYQPQPPTQQQNFPPLPQGPAPLDLQKFPPPQFPPTNQQPPPTNGQNPQRPPPLDLSQLPQPPLQMQPPPLNQGLAPPTGNQWDTQGPFPPPTSTMVPPLDLGGSNYGSQTGHYQPPAPVNYQQQQQQPPNYNGYYQQQQPNAQQQPQQQPQQQQQQYGNWQQPPQQQQQGGYPQQQPAPNQAGSDPFGGTFDVNGLKPTIFNPQYQNPQQQPQQQPQLLQPPPQQNYGPPQANPNDNYAGIFGTQNPMGQNPMMQNPMNRNPLAPAGKTDFTRRGPDPIQLNQFMAQPTAPKDMNTLSNSLDALLGSLLSGQGAGTQAPPKTTTAAPPPSEQTGLVSDRLNDFILGPKTQFRSNAFSEIPQNSRSYDSLNPLAGFMGETPPPPTTTTPAPPGRNGDFLDGFIGTRLNAPPNPNAKENQPPPIYFYNYMNDKTTPPPAAPSAGNALDNLGTQDLSAMVQRLLGVLAAKQAAGGQG